MDGSRRMERVETVVVEGRAVELCGLLQGILKVIKRISL